MENSMAQMQDRQLLKKKKKTWRWPNIYTPGFQSANCDEISEGKQERKQN